MTAPTQVHPNNTISIPSGLVACTTYGSIQAETAFWMMEARSFTEKQGVANIEYAQIPGALVDKARNDVLRKMLKASYGWALMIDGDMVGDSNAILQILQTAFGTHPHFDVVGAYCSLRGPSSLPTIDTGTGTWESHYPGNGLVEVIRTGGAFLLIKRHVAERIPDPWFALRVPIRPLDAVAEVDNYARTIFDGRNPFRDQPNSAWEKMEASAASHRSILERPYIAAEVGEDSSFCDRVKAAGLRIGVDTNIQVRHLTKEVRDWHDHKRAMDDRDRQQRLLSGLLA